MATYASIQNRVTITSLAGDPNNFYNQATAAIADIFNNSSAQSTITDWLNTHANQNIIITESASGLPFSTTGSGQISINNAALLNTYYLSTTGNAVNDGFEFALAHELGHAVGYFTDNASFYVQQKGVTNLKGDNVTAVNSWDAQLRFQQQAAYEANTNVSGLLNHNKDYTHGHAIDGAFVDVGLYSNLKGSPQQYDSANLNLAGLGIVGSMLIVGSSGKNIYSGTNSNDWIYLGGDTPSRDGQEAAIGGKGNDVINESSGSAVFGFNQTPGTLGHDVVEVGTGAGTYELNLSDLSPSDLTFIAGGQDIYGHAYLASDVAFEFVTFKVNSTGETITFVDQGRNVGSLVNEDCAQAGTSYAIAHTPVTKIDFASGLTWSATDLWNYVSDHVDHSNVQWNLMLNTPASISPTDPSSPYETEHNTLAYRARRAAGAGIVYMT